MALHTWKYTKSPLHEIVELYRYLKVLHGNPWRGKWTWTRWINYKCRAEVIVNHGVTYQLLNSFAPLPVHFSCCCSQPASLVSASPLDKVLYYTETVFRPSPQAENGNNSRRCYNCDQWKKQVWLHLPSPSVLCREEMSTDRRRYFDCGAYYYWDRCVRCCIWHQKQVQL